MCIVGEIEYPNFPRKVTHQHMVLLCVAPMTQAGTLAPEAVQANIDQAVTLAHQVEAATGHTVIVPHLELLRLPPANGQAAWEIHFAKYALLLRGKCDGIFQMPYNVEQDVECVSYVKWWHENRASIRIYRNLEDIPRFRQLSV